MKFDNLPNSEDIEACRSYRASLCKDNGFFGNTSDYFVVENPLNGETELETGSDVCKGSSSVDNLELVRISSQVNCSCLVNLPNRAPLEERR